MVPAWPSLWVPPLWRGVLGKQRQGGLLPLRASGSSPWNGGSLGSPSMVLSTGVPRPSRDTGQAGGAHTGVFVWLPGFIKRQAPSLGPAQLN